METVCRRAYLCNGSLHLQAEVAILKQHWHGTLKAKEGETLHQIHRKGRVDPAVLIGYRLTCGLLLGTEIIYM